IGSQNGASLAQALLRSGGSGGKITAATLAAERPWQHLVRRPGSWRKQLSLKARNMTVGQLVSTVRANRLTMEEVSTNLDLPCEVIKEALEYYEANRHLIEEEAAAERKWLAERGYPLEPPNLPG